MIWLCVGVWITLARGERLEQKWRDRGDWMCSSPEGIGGGAGTGVARGAGGRPRRGPWTGRPSEVGPGLLMGVRAGCDPHEEPRT